MLASAMAVPGGTLLQETLARDATDPVLLDKNPKAGHVGGLRSWTIKDTKHCQALEFSTETEGLIGGVWREKDLPV